MKTGMEIAKSIGMVSETCRHISERSSLTILSITDMEEFCRRKIPEQSIICVWQMQSIVWGKTDGDGHFLLPDEAQDVTLWLEARLFNTNAEIHLWRNGDVFHVRYVRDGESGSETFFCDSFSRFWGEEQSSNDGFVKLTDRRRKLTMLIPASPGCGWYGLRTRNYIGTEKNTGIAGFVDYRYVAIESAEAR